MCKFDTIIIESADNGCIISCPGIKKVFTFDEDAIDFIRGLVGMPQSNRIPKEMQQAPHGVFPNGIFGDPPGSCGALGDGLRTNGTLQTTGM